MTNLPSQSHFVPFRYEGIIVCVIRVDFRTRNTGGIKRHLWVGIFMPITFLKHINSASSLNTFQGKTLN